LPPLPPAGGPAGRPPDHEDIRSKVDDVVLSALVGEFRGMRRTHGQDGEPERGGGRADALDGLLSNYRSARFRAGARRAVRDGVSEGSSLGEFGDLAGPRAGVGSILRDRFILDAEIGRGGMGVVYAAVDRRRLEAGSARPYVALKLLNDAFRNDSEALRVLEAEARKAQSLAHPNIATVYDFDRDRSEIFIVMDLLSGKPLSRHLAAATGKGLPGQRVATILKGICAGLAYAHERGVVHSDLKPANIFITDDSEVKLLDFGLASAGNAGGFDATALNALTAPYASPEMFEGAERDPRDDIFALGCIAYQLLMGTHPFAMKPTDEAVAGNMVPEPIPDLDPAAWAAIVKALSFDRGQRTASVAEFFDGIFET
jgi:serine/threonine protein kinase